MILEKKTRRSNIFNRLQERSWPTSLVIQANAERLGAMTELVRGFWPGGSSDEMRMLTELSFCLFTVDDELDMGFPGANVEDVCAEFLPWLPATQPTKPIRQGVRLILRDVEAFLTERPPFGLLGSLWRREGEATLKAMWQEALWRVSGVTPDLDMYLHVAEKSITTSWMAATLMILTPRDWHPSQIDEAVEAAGAVSLAMRLANDLRSFEREKSEGKSGAVAILARREARSSSQTEIDEGRAKAIVRDLLRDAVSQSLDILQASAPLPASDRDLLRKNEPLSLMTVASLSPELQTAGPSKLYEQGLMGLLLGVLGYLEQRDFPRSVVHGEGGSA